MYSVCLKNGIQKEYIRNATFPTFYDFLLFSDYKLKHPHFGIPILILSYLTVNQGLGISFSIIFAT